MSPLIQPNSGLLFMKVGLHAGESLEQILERKRKEYKKAGCIFWGYGGGTCHPTRVVQPFARMSLAEGKEIYIVMEEIDSHHPRTDIIAKEYSEDGIDWKPIPKGIEVRGSRYAVVLDELKVGDLDLDLKNYKVALGPSMGRVAAQYVKGRVDKACILTNDSPMGSSDSDVKKIKLAAKIKKPFAVFTR